MSDIGKAIGMVAVAHVKAIKEAMLKSGISWKRDTTTSPRPDYLRGAFDGTADGYRLLVVLYHDDERSLDLFEGVATCSGPPVMVIHLPDEITEELYRNAEAKMN